jgi:NADPH-dependent ferric siderophore reductase
MTSQYRNITKKLSTVEKIFIKSGKIIAVRGWNGGNVHEIDVHLPNVYFEKWDKAQSIKCRISALHYTDYTPALWYVEKKICTVYIDTSHNGQGSIWAKNQVAGNDFHYSKIESEKHFPVNGKHLVFLGDQTGIGYFSALQQLATKNTPISGIITFNDLQTADAFSENCSWLPLQAVSNYNDIYKQTEDWANIHQAEKENFVFYVVGSAALIVTLRKFLRTYGFDGSQIKSKGFWH